ncbi:MAG: hypothetical protein H6597_06100 [Flavobacteriales bacterium]|nr:hypothetical protein [Flavobacteriales bacterium]
MRKRKIGNDPRQNLEIARLRQGSRRTSASARGLVYNFETGTNGKRSCSDGCEPRHNQASCSTRRKGDGLDARSTNMLDYVRTYRSGTVPYTINGRSR